MPNSDRRDGVPNWTLAQGTELEKAARALCVAEGYDPDALQADDYADEPLWSAYLPDAYAALTPPSQP